MPGIPSKQHVVHPSIQQLLNKIGFKVFWLPLAWLLRRRRRRPALPLALRPWRPRRLRLPLCRLLRCGWRWARQHEVVKDGRLVCNMVLPAAAKG